MTQQLLPLLLLRVLLPPALPSCALLLRLLHTSWPPQRPQSHAAGPSLNLLMVGEWEWGEVGWEKKMGGRGTGVVRMLAETNVTQDFIH